MSRIVAAFFWLNSDNMNLYTPVILLMEEIRLTTWNVKNIVNNGINYLSGPINWCRISEPSIVSLIISMRCVSLMSCKFPGLATRDDWGSAGISSSLVAAHMRKDTVRPPKGFRATQTTHNSKMV